MQRSLGPVAAALLLLLAAPSLAEEGRVYLGGQMGMFLPLESSVTGSFPGQSGDLSFDPGLVLAAIGGYAFGNGLRGEAELNFRYLTPDKLKTGGETIAVSADIYSYGFMTNVYYDFRNRTIITPYLGAGVGVALVDFGKGTSTTTTLWNSGTDVTVAYQGIAGFALRVDDRTSIDFVYHHYAVPMLHFNTLASQYRGLNLSVGLRRWF